MPDNANILGLLADEAVTCGMVSDALDAAGIAGMLPGCWVGPDAKAWGRVRTLRVGYGGAPVATSAYADWWDSLRPGEMVLVYGAAAWAFWGELSSRLALRVGLAGTVIDGLTRDTRRVQALGYGVWARGYSGLDIAGRGNILALDDRYAPVRPGDVLYADMDGVAAVPWESRAVVGEALDARIRAERRVRDAILHEPPGKVVGSAECL